MRHDRNLAIKKTLCAILTGFVLFTICSCGWTSDFSKETESREESTDFATTDAVTTTEEETTEEETTEEITEVYTGFPNDAEPDGTKRY